MIKVPLDQAEPGMILAQNITRGDGVLLAPKGAEVTDSLINFMKRLNYESVAVEIGGLESPEDKEKRIKKEAAEIEMRFSKVKSEVLQTGLKQALLARLHGNN